MKIFVTVGTQLPFDRLIRAMDAFQAQHPEHQVFAQVGKSNYTPKHLKATESVTRQDFAAAVAEADVVVAHAGIGTVLTALDAGKRLIVMPRLSAHGEHRNDHQIATAAELSRFSLVQVANHEGDVFAALDSAAAGRVDTIAHEVETSAKSLVKSIAAFIDAPKPRRAWSFGGFAALFGTASSVTE